MEVELKLLIATPHHALLRQHPLLAGLATRKQSLLAHYFDTPDLYLARHGAGLRVRKEEGAWRQTMKAGGSVQNGLHQRHEWEGGVSRAQPQLGKLRKLVGADTEWRQLLAAPELKGQLQRLFSVTLERELWQLDFAGSQIELALDYGQIEHADQHVPISEIELELLRGQPAHLFALALQLLERVPLQLTNTNKAERGYALCFPAAPAGQQAQRARTLALPPDATLDAARQAIVHNCLQQIQDNQRGVIEGADSEALHQMRVGVRRLRSALTLFESVTPCSASMRADWRWLAQVLGRARDWDVLASSTLARIQASPVSPDRLCDLPLLVQAQGQAQRHTVLQALQSAHYTRMQLELGRWLLCESPSIDALSYSRDTLRQLHKALLKRTRKMRDDDAASIHRTRIAAKRSRYALEFFRTLYRGKALRQYLATLARAQETLGQHNDLVVAERLLKKLGKQHRAAAAPIAYARGYLQALQATQPIDLAQLRAELHALPRF